MLKFRFFYSDKYHLGFARKFDVAGEDRYLIVLIDGSTLTIAQQYDGGSVNAFSWFQVEKAGEAMLADDLVQTLGAALDTAKEV